MRGDERLPADALRERDRTTERTPDGGREKDPIGFTLSAILRPADVPTAPRAPEVNQAGRDAARKKTELRLDIDMSASRLRIVLSGEGWVLPPDTEIRARSDRFGHIVVWPGAAKYRPLAPGSLTDWVRHPSELSNFFNDPALTPNIFRFVILWDRSQPELAGIEGVEDLTVTIQPD